MDAIPIVGGGLAGLSAAVALTLAGRRVVVFEQGADLGGRARSWTDETTGDAVDIGPHILLSAYRNMLDLLQQLGTQDRIAWQHDPFITMVEGRRETRLRSRHLPAPLPFLPSILASRTAPMGEKLSMSRVIRAALRLREADVPRLDCMPADVLLRRLRVGRRMIDWYWRSLCMFLLNVPLERCSAGALLRLFAYLTSANHLAPGFPKVGLSELYVPACLALIRRAGGDVRPAHAVRAVELVDGAVCGLRLADGTSLPARRCIVAVPPAELLALLPEAVSSAAPFAPVAGFEPSPYISAYLWFRRRLTRRQFWARVWRPESLSCEWYEVYNIRGVPENRGSLVATNIIYSGRFESLSDAQLVAALLDELGEYLDPEEPPWHARVHRVPMAVPCPYPGSEQRRLPVRTPLRGLFLAGDWTATALPACMEGAVRSGRLAAEALCADDGETQRLALAPPRPQGLARLARRRRRSLSRL